MSRRDDILTALRHAYGEGAGLDGLTAEQLLDAYRAEVLAEASAALRGLHDLAPNGPRAKGLLFALGVLAGVRDFPAKPGEVGR